MPPKSTFYRALDYWVRKKGHDDAWTMKLASQLGLEHTIRREGRPKLEKADVEADY